MMTKARGRPRGFDREAALDCALMEFWQHGYEATSIATLTGAMGINPPSLYASFGDKRTLFEEVVRRYLSEYAAFVPQTLADAPTARDAIDRVLHQAAVVYTDRSHPPGCLVASAATNCAPASADVQEDLRAGRRATQQAIQGSIEDDLRAGRLPAGTDAEALGAFYATVLVGMSSQARDGATEADLLRVADAAMRCWPG